VKAIARRRKKRLLNEKMLQDCRNFRSEKKARMFRGIKGTKITLGCSSAKIMAIMQYRNWEHGAISFARNEKLLLHTFTTIV